MFPKMERLGVAVAVAAGTGEEDRVWFARARAAEVAAVLSPDHDLEILCYDHRVPWVQLPGESGWTADELVDWTAVVLDTVIVPAPPVSVLADVELVTSILRTRPDGVTTFALSALAGIPCGRIARALRTLGPRVGALAERADDGKRIWVLLS